MKIIGRWKLFADGKLVAQNSNQVTRVTAVRVVSAFVNGAFIPFSYIAVGSGSTLETALDTALENELLRVAATRASTATVFANDTFQLSGSFTAAQDYSIGEIGIFDAVIAGALGARGTFKDITNLPAPRSVTSGQVIGLEYQIQVVV